MLTQLSIQGLAIIDTLAIEFTQGFNVITGETGAGKSILIKALSLLLGAKASGDVVRKGRESAVVSGTFEVPVGHRCLGYLADLAVPAEADGGVIPVIVRRSVGAKGRSLAWINDVPVTVHILREFAESMIDVFGQHENLKLLDAAQHNQYVDLFLKDRSLPLTYAGVWQVCQEKLRAVTEMVEAVKLRQRDADYLAFRCEELRKFHPTAEDFSEIDTLCRKAGHTLHLATGLEKAQACFDQGAGGEALSRPLWEAGRLLSGLVDYAPDLAPLADETNALASKVDDLSFAVGKAASGLEVDENDLESAQARLAAYQALFRKFGVGDVDGLLAEKERLESDLASLESASADLVARLKDLLGTSRELSALAGKLSKARLAAKVQVKSRIELELKELAMPGASLDVEFSPVSRGMPAIELGHFGDDCVSRWAEIADLLSSLSDHGAERAQILLAANQGEALLPLHKVASGGEVSRLMLAFKKALSAGADTCILVFDEIDTGISGRVADVVGRKLQELADNFQVICISHLAQVAAYAETHFLVHKFDKAQRTESTITRLSKTDSEREVARLLSGDEVTPSSLANAKALMTKAHKARRVHRLDGGKSLN